MTGSTQSSTQTAAMTPAELAELEALEAAATPGPWEADEWYGMDDGGWCAVGPHHQCSDDEDDCDDSPDSPPHQRAKADARFIAAARSALPRLLARVRELEVELERDGVGGRRRRRAAAEKVKQWKELEAQRDAARAQLAEAERHLEDSEEELGSLKEAITEHLPQYTVDDGTSEPDDATEWERLEYAGDELKRLGAQLAACQRERDEAVRLLRGVMVRAGALRCLDHACPECVPDSPIVIKEYACTHHRARAFLARLDAAKAGGGS